MKRYHLVKQIRTSCDCAANIPGTGMQERDDGDWVRYADVKHLIEPTAEADANTVLGDGWRDVKKELPERGTLCLTYTDDGFYVNQIYKDYWETEYPVYEGKVVAWKKISPPAFT